MRTARAIVARTMFLLPIGVTPITLRGQDVYYMAEPWNGYTLYLSPSSHGSGAGARAASNAAGDVAKHEQALGAAKECRSSSGLDETEATVRNEKEGEFVRANRPILDRHKERQQRQSLP